MDQLSTEPPKLEQPSIRPPKSPKAAFGRLESAFTLSQSDAEDKEDVDFIERYTMPKFSIRDLLSARLDNMSSKRETHRRRKEGPSAIIPASTFFRTDRVEDLSNQFPDASPSEIVNMLEQEWINLSDDNRRIYQAKSKKDREMFIEERKNYLPKTDGGRLKRKKKTKHPDAPKHPKSAFLFFAMDRRSEITKEFPDLSFSQVSTQLSAEFKALPVDRRQEYMDLAIADKNRYKEEKMQFEASPPPPVLEDPKEEKKAFTLDERWGKRQKVSIVPRHPLSSYLFFVALNRGILAEFAPEMSFKDSARILGLLWKRIDPKERRKFEIMAAVDKRRYEEEKKHIDAPAAKPAPRSLLPPSPSDASNKQRKPISAYAIWASEERAAVLEEHPEIDRKELTKILRQNWKELTPFEKLPYLELEKQERDTFRASPEPQMIPKSVSVDDRVAEESLTHAAPENVMQWTCSDIGRFIAGLGFPQYAEAFVQSRITGKEFVALSTGDLKRKFGIVKLGERKLIKEAIDQKLV